MSRIKTARIERKVKSEYKKKGMSKKRRNYIAGAVMGKIKRERAAKRRKH